MDRALLLDSRLIVRNSSIRGPHCYPSGQLHCAYTFARGASCCAARVEGEDQLERTQQAAVPIQNQESNSSYDQEEVFESFGPETTANEASLRIFEDTLVHDVERLAPPRRERVLSLEAMPDRRTKADLDQELVDRLVKDNITQKSMMKLGRRGVTNQIRQDAELRWNTKEVIKVHADHKSIKGNMKLTGQLLEEATGGIVIWQSGSKMLLYRDDEGRKARKALDTERMKIPELKDRIPVDDSLPSEAQVS